MIRFFQVDSDTILSVRFGISCLGYFSHPNTIIFWSEYNRWVFYFSVVFHFRHLFHCLIRKCYWFFFRLTSYRHLTQSELKFKFLWIGISVFEFPSFFFCFFSWAVEFRNQSLLRRPGFLQLFCLVRVLPLKLKLVSGVTW